MQISSLKIDWNLGKNFWFDRQDPSLGHLFVRFKSDAKVYTKNGFMQAKPGNFIFYNEEERTAYGSENWEFNHDFFRFYLSEAEASVFDVPTSTLFTSSMPEKAESVFRMLTVEFFSASAKRDMALDLIGRLFFLEASVFSKTEYADRSVESRHQALAKLRMEMLNAPQKPWTIEELAGRAMLNATYFQKLYKQFFGMSCMQEVLTARIRMAENLLLSTNKKETEIAMLCGYNNIEHFIRQFKKFTGRTPSAFKKRYIGAENIFSIDIFGEMW